jgi:hypothetical protein
LGILAGAILPSGTFTGSNNIHIGPNVRPATASESNSKEDISDMGDASNGHMKLRPVTFYYKPECAD